MFATDLALYDQSPEVLALQQFLNAHGFLIALSGPGSPGEETSFFGLATYHALVNYQATNDLPATGYLGPDTRALVSGTAAASSNKTNTTTSSQLSENKFTTTQSAATSSATSIPLSPPIVSLSYGGGGEGGGGADTIPPGDERHTIKRNG